MPKLSPSVLLYVPGQQGMYVVSNEALLTHSWRHVTRRQNTKQEDKGVHNMEGMTWVRIGMRPCTTRRSGGAAINGERKSKT